MQQVCRNLLVWSNFWGHILPGEGRTWAGSAANNKDSGFWCKIAKLGKALHRPLHPQQVDIEVIVLPPDCFLPSPVLDGGAWKSL